MNRQEFLNRLQAALNGEISPQAVQTNLRYYRDYISSEIAKGRSEREVMEELGDPRLIAKTIIDTERPSGDGGTRTRYQEPRQHAGSRQPGAQKKGRAHGVGPFRSWRTFLIVAAVVVLVLLFFMRMFTMVFTLLTSPIFWVILAVCVIGRFVSRRTGRHS